MPTFEEQYKTILSTSGGSTKEQKKGATEEKEADDNGIMEELIVGTAKLAMTSRHTASLSLAATEARQQRGREARLLLHPSDASTGVHLCDCASSRSSKTNCTVVSESQEIAWIVLRFTGLP